MIGLSGIALGRIGPSGIGLSGIGLSGIAQSGIGGYQKNLDGSAVGGWSHSMPFESSSSSNRQLALCCVYTRTMVG